MGKWWLQNQCLRASMFVNAGVNQASLEEAIQSIYQLSFLSNLQMSRSMKNMQILVIWYRQYLLLMKVVICTEKLIPAMQLPNRYPVWPTFWLFQITFILTSFLLIKLNATIPKRKELLITQEAKVL